MQWCESGARDAYAHIVKNATHRAQNYRIVTRYTHTCTHPKPCDKISYTTVHMPKIRNAVVSVGYLGIYLGIHFNFTVHPMQYKHTHAAL